MLSYNLSFPVTTEIRLLSSFPVCLNIVPGNGKVTKPQANRAFPLRSPASFIKTRSFLDKMLFMTLIIHF